MSRARGIRRATAATRCIGSRCWWVDDACREFGSPLPLAGEVGSRSDPGGGMTCTDLAPSLTLLRKRGRGRARGGTSLLSVLLFLAAASVVFAQPAQFTPGDEKPEDYPAGAGRDDTFYLCTACHGFKIVAQQGLTRRQWEDSLQWMTDRPNMAPLPPKEREIGLNYLEATFPRRSPASRRGRQ